MADGNGSLSFYFFDVDDNQQLRGDISARMNRLFFRVGVESDQ